MACGAHSVTRTRSAASSSSRLVLGIRLTLGVCFRNTLFYFWQYQKRNRDEACPSPPGFSPRGPAYTQGAPRWGSSRLCECLRHFAFCVSAFA